VLGFALFLGGYGLLPHWKAAMATPTVGLPVAFFHRIRKIARAATGRPLVVVLIPDEIQVNPDLEVAVETLRGIRLDPDRPNRLVAEELSGEEVVLIDLLPALRLGHSEPGRVYHLQNTHWNANGNRVAAAVAVEALLAEPDLIPCGTQAQSP
jgi:SGNH hydrolase-like domain, acetyltransferase AlgX